MRCVADERNFSTGLGKSRCAYDERTRLTRFDNPYTFTGRRLDDESGIDYYRNRYYHAQLGRFVSRDPMEYVDGLNTYQIGNSAPLRRTDSYGLASLSQVTSDPPTLQYSCKCGWIDWTHAEEKNPRLREMWESILGGKGDPSLSGGGRKVCFGLTQEKFGLSSGVRRCYYVSSTLTTSEEESAALAIYQDVANAFESHQIVVGLPPLLNNSGFSAEDLP